MMMPHLIFLERFVQLSIFLSGERARESVRVLEKKRERVKLLGKRERERERKREWKMRGR